MKKKPFDMRHLFMARSSEEVKSHFNTMCVVRQGSCYVLILLVLGDIF